MENNFGEKHYPFCFMIHATQWVKKANEVKEPRDFFLAAESELDMTNWVFRVSYQIDFYKLKDQSQLASHAAEPKLDVMSYSHSLGSELPVLADDAPGARSVLGCTMCA